MSFRKVVLTALSLFVVSHGSLFGQAQAPAAQVTELRAGDAVKITVWRKPEMSGEFTIAEDGTITHPLYRSISVVGVPVPAARQRVHDYLARLESNPEFVMEPLLRVSVGGEVRQPSLYRVAPETTVAQAVAIAGGVNDRGALDRVRLFRDGQELRVDLTRPQMGLAQSPIRSGDQLFVGRKISIFRDYIAPAGGVLAALAAFTNILIRN